MTPPEPPHLAPPGAGLPAHELFFARRLFALKRLLGSRQRFTRTFAHERDVILSLTRSSDPALRGRPVLIPRLRGLEDSSRFWSVWMTLEHLRITNTIFAQVIQQLAQGQVPAKKASTADVKPDPGVGAGVEAAFEESCGSLLSTVAAVADLNTQAKYAHPWFGPLDAAGWHALAAMHLAIHRAQIREILSRLHR